MNAELKREKSKQKRKAQEKRRKIEKETGEPAPGRTPQKTLDNTREMDETIIVDPNDEEIAQDDALDEFAAYFSGDKTPKILITSSVNPSKVVHEFIQELLTVFPNSEFKKRRKYHLKEIVQYCKNQGEYTDVMVINEDKKEPNGMLLCHLPDGPTAFFKLSSRVPRKAIQGHGNPTGHYPELILNNFSTRIGQRMARFFASLFPQKPEFEGRRVVTLHNQRDFIFFRHHRYIIDGPDKARLQELGPRFTLKLKYLQHGTFDNKYGEYEWMPKKEKITSRRKFFM